MKLVPDDALAIITIWQEARNQPYLGMVAVGEVIRRRMARRYNSDGTMAGTVCRAWQFSGWNTDDPNRVPSLCLDDADPIVQQCEKAWEHSASSDFSRGAVLYCNLKILPTRQAWAKESKRVAEIGDHTFFAD